MSVLDVTPDIDPVGGEPVEREVRKWDVRFEDVHFVYRAPPPGHLPAFALAPLASFGFAAPRLRLSRQQICNRALGKIVSDRSRIVGLGSRAAVRWHLPQLTRHRSPL